MYSSVKFDHVAYRARFNKPFEAPAFKDAYLAGKNLNYFYERDHKEAFDYQQKTGQLLKPLDKTTKKREELFQQKFRGVMQYRSTLPKPKLAELHEKALPAVAEYNKNPRHVKKLGTGAIPELDYATVALVHMALDPKTRADMLQKLIDEAQKNENDELLIACIAAGVDFRINAPLDALTDKMSPQDHLKFLQHKLQALNPLKDKPDDLLKAQFTALTAKAGTLKKKSERNAIYHAISCWHPDVSEAKKAGRKIEKPAKRKPREQSAAPKEKTPTLIAIAKQAIVDKGVFAPAYLIVVNSKPSTSKTKAMFMLRDDVTDQDKRRKIHERAIAEASFKDLINDTVKINTERKRLNKEDKMKGSGDLYYLYKDSMAEIGNRPKTLDDQRVFELNRDLLSEYVFEGTRAKPKPSAT